MKSEHLLQEVEKSVKVLKKGGTILYPTDTVWGLGCDATSPKAVQKIYAIKRRKESQSFIVLLDEPSKINDYVKHVPETLWDLLSSLDKPTTIIYPKGKNLAKNVLAKDNSIAIRVVKEPFCKKVVEALGKPIVSTSANFTGDPAPLSFSRIPESMVKEVDYAVNYNRDRFSTIKPSTIIRLKENDEFEIIRS